MSDSLNLSDWALRHRPLVWFFMVLIVAEFYASTSGLGHLMYEAKEMFETAVVVAALLITGLVGLTLEGVVKLIMTKVFGAASTDGVAVEAAIPGRSEG